MELSDPLKLLMLFLFSLPVFIFFGFIIRFFFKKKPVEK